MRFTRGGLVLLALMLFAACSDDPATPPAQEYLDVELISPYRTDCPEEAFTVRVEANFPLVRAEFSVDGELVAVDEEAPFEYLWNVALWADGTRHSLVAHGRDESGRDDSGGGFAFTIPVGTGGVLLDPVRGAGVYEPTAVPLRWMRDPADPEFEIMVASEPGFAEPNFTTTTSDTATTAAVEDQQWNYWRVRQRLDEGEWEPWSEIGVIWGGAIFDREYGGGEFAGTVAVAQAADGGYYIAGKREFQSQPLLRRLDPLGEMLWSYEPSARGWLWRVDALPDGGCIAAGTIGSSYGTVIRFDANGGEVWNNTYGGPEDEGAVRTLTRCSDGNYLVAGHLGENAWALKMEGDGQTIWEQTYQAGPIRQTAEMPGGGYLFAGDLGAGRSSTLLYVDEAGELVWENPFSHDRTVGLHVDETRIVVLDEYIIRFFSLDGTELSHSSLGTSFLTALAPAGGGGFLVGGVDLLLEVDNTGTELRSWDFARTILDIEPTSDGGFAFTGTKRPLVKTVGIWLTKTNADLDFTPPAIELPEAP